MDRPTIQKVAKLLAKAESTDSEPEAIALVEKCYGILAQLLTEHDAASRVESPAGPRRRERRRLFDRRGSRLAEATWTSEPSAAAARYRRSTDEPDPGGSVIDVSA
jgi:hypothetical protein